MKLDTLSKQCIIIATFAIALCIDCSVMTSLGLGIIYESGHDAQSIYIAGISLKCVTYVAAAVISILKIIGIKKRRANLVVPWMVAAFGGLAFYVFDIVLRLNSQYYSHFDFWSYTIAVFGVAFVILYPLLTVFASIRREQATAENQQNQNKCDFEKFK